LLTSNTTRKGLITLTAWELSRMKTRSEKQRCVACHSLQYTALVPLQAAGIPSEWRPCCTNSSHPIEQVYSSTTRHITQSVNLHFKWLK